MVMRLVAPAHQSESNASPQVAICRLERAETARFASELLQNESKRVQTRSNIFWRCGRQGSQLLTQQLSNPATAKPANITNMRRKFKKESNLSQYLLSPQMQGPRITFLRRIPTYDIPRFSCAPSVSHSVKLVGGCSMAASRAQAFAAQAHRRCQGLWGQCGGKSRFQLFRQASSLPTWSEKPGKIKSLNFLR